MVGTLDTLAVIYAYLLAFIILAIIVVAVRISTQLLTKKEAIAPIPEVEVAKPEVAKEVPKPATAEAKVVAAAAAVAAHLSLQQPRVAREATTTQYAVPRLWIHQWRAQVSRSPNELCLIKFTHRKQQVM